MLQDQIQQMTYSPDVGTTNVHSSTWNQKYQAIKAPIRGLCLFGEYTVTDAGIAAGENIRGLIDRVEVYRGSDKIFEIKTNQFDNWSEFYAGWEEQVKYDEAGTAVENPLVYDALPTTATSQDFSLYIPFCHDFTNAQNPEVRVYFQAATSEWAGASAFVCSVYCGFDVDPAMRGVKDVVYTWSDSVSQAWHEKEYDDFFDAYSFMWTQSTGYVTKVTHSIGANSMYTNADEHQLKQFAYTYFRREGRNPDGTYVTNLMDGFIIPAAQDRKIRIEHSAACTITNAYVLGVYNGRF